MLKSERERLGKLARHNRNSIVQMDDGNEED